MKIEKVTDTEAIGKVYKEYYRLIYKVCNRFLHDHTTIDDLLQEAYFAVVYAVQHYDEGNECKFSTYLVKVLTWYFISKMQQDKSKNEVLILDSPLTEEDTVTRIDFIPDTSAEFEDSVIHSAALKAVYPTVKEILTKHENSNQTIHKGQLYAIINARYAEAMTYKTVTQQLGCSHQQARALEQRALRILRHPKYSMRLYKIRYGLIDSSYRKCGMQRFKYTSTSSTEWAVLELERIKEIVQQKRHETSKKDNLL